MKNCYLIVGQSGSGKTTIVNALEEKYGLKSIQSYTTRPKRSDNETGHIFISDEEYDKLENIVACTEICNYRYCATAEQINESDLYVIDPAGVESLKAFYKGNKQFKIIYIKSDITTRYERMRFRSQKSGKQYLKSVEETLNRIVHDSAKFYKYEHEETPIDLVVNNGWNDDIPHVAEQIYRFIEKCEKEQWIWSDMKMTV